METLNNIASCAGYIITIVTLLTLLIKPLRDRITKIIAQKKIDEHQNQQLDELITKVDTLQDIMAERYEELESIREALKCSIRNNITHLYYKYTQRGSIPILERENII